MKSISWCTTCMGRLWQLEQTLGHNLACLRPDEEICLVNYNSQDGLDEYIRNNYSDAVASGQLRYYHTTVPCAFDMAIAKNAAHRLSTGRVLFNLDADNFIGTATSDLLRRLLVDRPGGFVFYEGPPIDRQVSVEEAWAAGRLAFDRYSFFQRLGGYDEAMPGVTHEDTDIFNRAIFGGLTPVVPSARTYRPAVGNSTEDQVKNTRDASANTADRTYTALYGNNLERRLYNSKWGVIRVNPGGFAQLPGRLNFGRLVPNPEAM